MSVPTTSAAGRGVPFCENPTEESLNRIISAFIEHLRHEYNVGSSDRIAIGFDGRSRSRIFALLASDAISKSGLGVLRASGVVPVPALSLATKRQGCAAGIMFTGGSAPPDDLRLEFKSGRGAPLSGKEILKIGARSSGISGAQFDFSALHPGPIAETDFLPDYRTYIKSAIDIPALTRYSENPKNNASVLIDSMGGAGQTIIEEILVESGWRAQTLFGTPQPNFFDRRPNPLPEHLQALRYNVSVVDAHLGIATDGDGGTCGILLGDGEALDIETKTGALLWHLTLHRKRTGVLLKGAQITASVTRTILENPMSVITVKSIVDSDDMDGSGWFFAASNDGEYAYGPELPERDGILTGLMFVDMIAASGKTLREIVAYVRAALLPSSDRNGRREADRRTSLES